MLEEIQKNTLLGLQCNGIITEIVKKFGVHRRTQNTADDRYQGPGRVKSVHKKNADNLEKVILWQK